jgi:tRNA-2-methylthio-N6-dimethylallyladenosine synthase
VEESRSLERFDLPERHPALARATPGRAFLTVMEGCDMFCSFCVVPRTRGREISRPAAAILAEARRLAEDGIREITLLGQTVNAYGRHDVARGRAAARGVVPFAELLRELDAIPGLERIRYTSPHPVFFDADLIRAHGELERLCPHVHLPLQSGSDRILERMRRRYTAERYRAIVAGLRAARPDVAITSDVIVGFPGESEADFAATLALVEDVALADHFPFKYSPRPGTAAAELPETLPDEVVQERFDRLQALQDRLRFAAYRAAVGRTCPVLVEGPSRRGGGQLRGSDPWHRVVILEGGGALAPGDLLDVTIVEATPHSLLGEPVPGTVRQRTSAGTVRPASGRARQDGVKTGPHPADELRRGEPSRARRLEASA